MVRYEVPNRLLELLPLTPPPPLPPREFRCDDHHEYVYPENPRSPPECQKCLTQKIRESVLLEMQEELPRQAPAVKKRKSAVSCCWKITKCTYSCYKCAGCLLLTLTIFGVLLWVFILVDSERNVLVALENNKKINRRINIDSITALMYRIGKDPNDLKEWLFLITDYELSTTKIKAMSKFIYVAMHDFTARQPDELSFPKGAEIKFISFGGQEGWYQGEYDGKRGLFPVTHTSKVTPKIVLLRYSANEIVPFENKKLNGCFIGSGATASVYKVTITDSQNEHVPPKHVALKKYSAGFYNKENAVALLKKEALLVKELLHENTIYLHGFCTDEEYFGLLLELCEGGSLRSFCHSIDPNTSIPLETLINWAFQIASGMAYLRVHGKVHRDLKADNVLVKQKRCLCGPDLDLCPSCGGTGLNRLTLKIADFGTTRHVDTVTQNKEVGTYAWLAPEAFRAREWTEASDVWAFGVVMWEIMTRDTPHKGLWPGVPFSIVQRGQTLEIGKKCPAKWKQIMQSCWEKEPTNRPTFQKLAYDLKEYENQVKGKHIHVKPSAKSEAPNIPHVLTPADPPSRRHSSSRPSSLISKSPSQSMQNILGAAGAMSRNLQNSALSVASMVTKKLTPSSSSNDIRSKTPRSSRESSDSNNRFLLPNSVSSGYSSASNPMLTSPNDDY